MEPVFLTSRQLAEKYPVADMDNEVAWYRRLAAWRTDGRLAMGVDWKYSTRMTRVYAEVSILRIVAREKSDIFCDAVKIEHHVTIRSILTVCAIRTSDKSA